MSGGASWLPWDLAGLWGYSGQQSGVLALPASRGQCGGRHPHAGWGGPAHKDAVVKIRLLAWRDRSRAWCPQHGRPRCTRGLAVVPRWKGGASSCATQRPSTSCSLLARECCRPQPRHLNHDPIASERHPIPPSRGPWAHGTQTPRSCHTAGRPGPVITETNVRAQRLHPSVSSFPGRNAPTRAPRCLTCQGFLVVLPHGDEVPQAGVELLHDGLRESRAEST